MRPGNLTIAFIFIGFFAKADQPVIMLDSANTAYSKGDFSKAIELYEGIANKGLESSELYFNIGNAYFKSNNIALAILYYERAKKLNPSDEDIIVNLKLANQKVEDKIEAAPQLFLTQWKNGIVDMMSETAWSVFCIILFAMALILFSIFITSGNRSLKQTGFFGGMVFIISAVVTLFIAQQKYTQTKYNSDAIITSASVTVMGSPNEKGTKLFVLHEGIKVNVTQENDGWSEIKIANGNVGWVKRKDVTAI
ncbi:MAG: hypothetical protein A3F72_04975 [Bacteroidetes bacterium RIFCSPLOWO2_12_FULL_35_15]|nr:MAG: hypothetical protein A3F72_04975 [Bacteroidetes bacterium RIFCSPLOWO2_12_FULL_35_15]